MSSVASIALAVVAFAAPTDFADLLLPMRMSVEPQVTPELARVAPSVLDALRLAGERARSRESKLREAEQTLLELTSMLEDANNAKTSDARLQAHAALTTMSGAELQRVGEALMDALRLEAERLELVEIAALEARLRGVALDGADPGLTLQLRRQARSPRAAQLVDARVEAYRNVALGVADHLAGDHGGALDKLQRASTGAPDLPLTHLYYGSFCYLAGEVECARLAWMRALDLDPDNEIVGRALHNLEQGLAP